MAKECKIELLITGVMCCGCGNKIYTSCSQLPTEIKEAKIYFELLPLEHGQFLLKFEIYAQEDITAEKKENIKKTLIKQIKDSDAKLSVIEYIEKTSSLTSITSKKYDKNIAIAILTFALIIGVNIFLPPSILLTFFTTLATIAVCCYLGRDYIKEFFKNFKNKKFEPMAISVSFGWLFSALHLSYHAIKMPLMSGFATINNHLMALSLFACVNLVDKMKLALQNRLAKFKLIKINTLFPGITEEYEVLESTTYVLKEDNEKIVKPTKEEWQQFEVNIKNKNYANKRRITLAKGMLIKIRSGQALPVDGIVVEGESYIDSSVINGENAKPIKFGDKISGGAINLGDDITIIATTDYYNCALNKNLFFSNKPEPKNATGFFGKNKKFYFLYGALITVSIIAAITFPPLLGALGFGFIFKNLIAVLFAICPCTLALALTMPDIFGQRKFFKQNIFLKKSQVLERQEPKTVVFDKTGTLTTGECEVESILGFLPYDIQQEILNLQLAKGANHPIGKAIINVIEKNGLKSRNTEYKFKRDNKGRGLISYNGKTKIVIGNYELVSEDRVFAIPERLKAKIQEKEARGLTAIYVTKNGFCSGVFFVKHTVRESAIETIKKLKEKGVKCVLLTGDNKQSAKGFNRQIGDLFEEEQIIAGKNHLDKKKYISSLYEQNEKSCSGIWFIGDGQNDATSSRFVSENGGVSCAVEDTNNNAYFSDVILNNNFSYLLEHENARKLQNKIKRQNQLIVLTTTSAILSMSVLAGIFALSIPMFLPMLLMTVSTVAVTANSYKVELNLQNNLANKIITSDATFALAFTGSTFLVAGIITNTCLLGAGFSISSITLTAGIGAAIASASILSGGIALGVIAVALAGIYLYKKFNKRENNSDIFSNVAVKHQGTDFQKQQLNRESKPTLSFARPQDLRTERAGSINFFYSTSATHPVGQYNRPRI